MTKHDKLRIVQAALLNRLLLILIALMIASLFSVLLIRAALLKDRQASVEPNQISAVACCASNYRAEPMT